MFIKRKITTEEDRAKAIAKTREKQRKKMIKTKYGQAPLRHSKKGIYSCFYGVVVFILLVLMLIIICKQGRGEYPNRIHRTWYAGAILYGPAAGRAGLPGKG